MFCSFHKKINPNTELLIQDNKKNNKRNKSSNNNTEESETIINEDEFGIINTSQSKINGDNESEYLNNYNNYIIQNKNPKEEEQLRYDFLKEYSKIRPNTQDDFLTRMEIDIKIRTLKDKAIDEFIDKTKLKMNEEDRIKSFNRLINDTNRRYEAKERIELYKQQKEDEEIEKLRKASKKKYNPNKWNELYQNRFGNNYENIKNRLEEKIRKQIFDEKKIENNVINLYINKKIQNKTSKDKDNSNRLYDIFMMQKEKLINKKKHLESKRKEKVKNMFSNRVENKPKRNKSAINYKKNINNKNKNNNYIINDYKYLKKINENLNSRNGNNIDNKCITPSKYSTQYKKICNLGEGGN